MPPLTRRRRSLLVTAGAALAFVAVAALTAMRRGRDTYRPGEDVEGLTADLARDLPPDYPRVAFTDVTRAAGIAYRHFDGARTSRLPEDMGSGAAWGDYDGDGWPDLAVANEVGRVDLADDARRRSPARAALYHNERDGTFTDVTARAGIDFHGWGMAAAWADYDGDGHLDLLLTAYGHNVLYRGNGDGTFTDRSAASGVGAPEGFWTGAAWGDYDRDGRLDLYVTGYVRFSRERSTSAGVGGRYDVENPASINPLAFPPERNLLFHNEGDGTFTERAARAGVLDSAGRGMAATWADLDDDGWPDLYVANDVSRNALYHNERDGTFREIGESARVSDYRSSMGIAVGDWNGDGAQDLFLTHWLAQGNALYDNKRAAAGAPLAFMDESDRYGLGQLSLDFVGWATSFVDYDDDGRPDLFVVNGSTLQQRDDPRRMVPMPSRLFWNRGARDGFFDVSPVSGAYFATAYVGRGAAFADYDRDGDVDAFVVNHGAPGVLLRNDGGNRNHWLQVELRGTRSNRQGIGARVRVVAGGAGQLRQVGVQSPYLSQNEPVETFGLGRAAAADTVEVRWPSGARSARTAVAAGRRLVIVEGDPPPTAGAPNDGPPRAPARDGDRASVQRFWALYREATARRAAGELRPALDGYARALALDPDHEDALYYLGGLRLELGDFAGAAAAWRRLIAVNPASARAHSRLGALHACLARGAPFALDSAERHLLRAHDINREENGPLLRLGEVALLRGRAAEARRYFATVLATNAGSAPAWFYTGYLAWKAGDAEGARAAFARARAPSAPPAAARGPGEGDTKRGAAARPIGDRRCEELRALAEAPPDGAAAPDMAARYRALDALLAAGRGRAR